MEDEFSSANHIFSTSNASWGSILSHDNGTEDLNITNEMMILDHKYLLYPHDLPPNFSSVLDINSYNLNSIPHQANLETSNFPLSAYTIPTYTNPYDFTPIPNETQGLTESIFGELPPLLYSSEEVLDCDRVYSGSSQIGFHVRETNSIFGSPLKYENFNTTLTAHGKSRKRKAVSDKRQISLEVLERYFSGSLKNAAKSIGVCPTTLKNICRKHGIKRWPSRRIKKIGDALTKIKREIESDEGVSSNISLDSIFANFPELSKSPDSSIVTSFSKINLTQSSSSSDLLCSTGSKHTVSLPPLPKSNCRVSGKSMNSVKVKASLLNQRIRFSLPPTWFFKDLRREISKRFSIDEVSKIRIMYLDEDEEWIALMCDADLDECIDIHKRSSRRTIKIAIHFNNSQSSS